MAEYINREEIEKKARYRKELGFPCVDIIDIHETPTADVIERSKIDKAIAEITNLNRYQEGIDTMNVGDDLMISWCKTLDILKEIQESRS